MAAWYLVGSDDSQRFVAQSWRHVIAGQVNPQVESMAALENQLAVAQHVGNPYAWRRWFVFYCRKLADERAVAKIHELFETVLRVAELTDPHAEDSVLAACDDPDVATSSARSHPPRTTDDDNDDVDDDDIVAVDDDMVMEIEVDPRPMRHPKSTANGDHGPSASTPAPSPQSSYRQRTILGLPVRSLAAEALTILSKLSRPVSRSDHAVISGLSRLFSF
ncbi:hypothetical protein CAUPRSCDRAFT_13010 [Caulochytrium protostelioides]|uniref:Protein HIRA-like C-terminal domain-containing protein n=1 Tax=Caulochytrium protostelioides TaxID=1555241 RepID=A0A4V1ISZ5_9FUNG|nr:hypothetical protein CAUPRSCDRAFT_13010 [Caulochytrium protostelioides]